MQLFEKTVSSENIFNGKVVKLKKDVVELPNGETAVREVITHSGGASVIAEDDGYIYFVKQFRYPYNKVLLEIPAGKLNDGENPETCALRELEEETGLKAKSVTLLHSIYPTPAYTSEITYIYLANELEKGSAHLDDDEFLNVEKISVDKVKQMLINGEIHDAKTIVALYAFFNKAKI
ncbi:MAG: NUDIX hydrolase [Clostridia bacterium]|nr:NUDIX hydrolase [Clostridia bacterium]